MNKNSRCEQKHLICEVTKSRRLAALADKPSPIGRMSKNGHGGSRVPGEGKKLGWTTRSHSVSTMSDTEHAGRTMTLTKPTLRSSLGNEHFNVQAGSLGGPQLARLPPGRCDGLCQALEGRWQPLGHHERCDRPARKGGAGAQGQGAQGHIPLVRKQSGSNLSANLPSCALSASRRVAGHRPARKNCGECKVCVVILSFFELTM